MKDEIDGSLLEELKEVEDELFEVQDELRETSRAYSQAAAKDRSELRAQHQRLR